MTHTQNTPPDNESGAQYANFWDVHTASQRAEPRRVGSHRAIQLEPAPKWQWWKYLIAIVCTFVIVTGLVFLGAYTPFGGAA
ncbi:hypothetical protein ACMTN4_07275 [Rhodococcus globerulus]|uniref:hypothetical protein n=1 Tax=Rhodococcus globerulus TaxID=33008 RepID=UPI0039EB6CEE